MNSRISLYRTIPHPCSYLDDLEAVNLIVDPELKLSPAMYERLLENGFRRSGCMVYRPDCDNCSACHSSRVPVEQFLPNRSQRRAWNRVTGQIHIKTRPAQLENAQFDLYQHYIQARHDDGDMKDSSAKQLMDFLTCDWSHTHFVEIYLENQLLAVAVTDEQPGSLSALYTWFDPKMSALSPGVVAIQAQLQMARELGKKWLYLGFWIKDSSKMAYKSGYQPLEIFKNNRWELLKR